MLQLEFWLQSSRQIGLSLLVITVRQQAFTDAASIAS